jgi:hypothetical protein
MIGGRGSPPWANHFSRLTSHFSHFEDYYVFKKFSRSCLPTPVIMDSG